MPASASIYGGGSVGLMGTVARAVLDDGGSVTGIIPRFLQSRERPMTDLTELIVTDDMHQRKMLMFEQADAFVALPGGVGTLEELVEQMTWAQLGRHEKPVLLANIAGFWDPLIRLLDQMRRGRLHPRRAGSLLPRRRPRGGHRADAASGRLPSGRAPKAEETAVRRRAVVSASLFRGGAHRRLRSTSRACSSPRRAAPRTRRR